ncbi:serine/threonine kinase [Culex quinquefasciatus]|uniref:Serine/threonine kinase n=2 Tax=Culex pipiens complex TaxID=518105 RepID=B0W7L1_CULQU|nr:ejaculatory bulb-specific protein 3 [Culex quinquefasciatus]EDS38046.1 serine/threonine kinase [Culex quinquefasciatus]|eukprot:XP_001844695.1 serine/threonine kinase [Culex quinquefasciatus]
MKFFVAIFAALLAVAAAQELYTSKYDSVDVDEILKSDRLFKNYYQCLLEDGRCTPEGNELKRILPEALETNCAKCSEKQRSGAIKAFGYLSENRPEEWKALRARFDPENKYLEQYREEGEKNGIKF